MGKTGVEEMGSGEGITHETEGIPQSAVGRGDDAEDGEEEGGGIGIFLLLGLVHLCANEGGLDLGACLLRSRSSNR